MNRLYGVYDRADRNSLEFFYKGRFYPKKEIDKAISTFEIVLAELFTDLKNKRVYLDIKDKFLFLISFLTLKKLDVTTVLIPIEINPEIYEEDGIICISDNKRRSNSLFLKEDLTLEKGEKFDLENISDFDNRYDLYFFTSGSTGRSKNIGKWTGNIITELMELYRLFKPGKNDIFLATPPFYHIYGFLFGVMLPIYSASKLDLTNLFTPESLAEYVRSNKVDYFISVPSYYCLLDQLNLIDSFKKVKFLFSSSAPLPLDVSKNFFSKNIRIHEIYGSTETGGVAYRVSAECLDYSLFSYIKVLNHVSGQEMELLLNSPAISVDYDQNEGFNTGDIVQFGGDRQFTLLGRNTRFVKIHGKRVDLGFVASIFRSYMKESQDIVIPEDKVYIGCKEEMIYILVEVAIKKEGDIINDLKKLLPGYAIPKKIIQMKIPKNEMGKINKVAIESLI